jgi:hypothetical protein
MIDRCLCCRVLAKLVFSLAIAVTAVTAILPFTIGQMEALAQQVDLEAEEPLTGGPIPNDEFRALAAAQLDAIALMCNLYIVDKGEYPKDLYELMASEYWVADIENVFTGNSIQQIQFTPRDSDFEQDGWSIYPLPNIRQSGAGTQDIGQGSRSNGGNGDGAATGPVISIVSVVPPRLDPARIGLMEPGNVLYYAVGGGALQLIMWMNNEVYADYFQTSPNEGAIRQYKLIRELNPSDKSVLAIAVLIEDALPRSYSLWQFNSGQEPLLPMDIPKLTWAEREKQFEALKIYPRNPILRGRVALVKEFMTGMIADLGDGAVPPVYCMSGKRLRMLREMTDEKYLRQSENIVREREMRFFGTSK